MIQTDHTNHDAVPAAKSPAATASALIKPSRSPATEELAIQQNTQDQRRRSRPLHPLVIPISLQGE